MKAAATKTLIIDAARQLFSQKGFAGIAMSEIAAAAGVTQSLIHHHFGSKADLWQHVSETYRDDFEELWRVALQNHEDFLTVFATKLFRFLRRHPEMALFETWRRVETVPECPAERLQRHRQFVTIIKEMQRHGRIRRDIDADCLMAAIMGMMLFWFSRDMKGIKERSSRNDGRYINTVVTLLTDGACAVPLGSPVSAAV